MLSLANVMFASTLNYPHDPRFAARAEPLILPPWNKTGARHELRQFIRVLRVAGKKKTLLLNSSWGRLHPDLLAAAVVGLWPRRYRPAIVLAGCMWEPTQGWRGIIEKTIVKLADRAISHYAVQSSEELTLFPDTWGVSPAKMRLCPYFFRVSDQVDFTTPVDPADHIFAGGNSHRNYEPLLEAARHFPERPFILATHLLKGRRDLPPNVTAGPVTPETFTNLTRSAAAVVVPMRSGLRRAVGQQTYLGAMWLGKPTIVSDTLGVRDHIRDGETALIVDGSTESYVKALTWVLDPAHREQVARLCCNARETVSRQFTTENYVTHLLAVLDETIHVKAL